ncbi:MAG: hypothetical protein HZB95_12600 [Nitrosomonadales bacterium]|nr:hypothetical protein [Nitrosomonadales bacterium]
MEKDIETDEEAPAAPSRMGGILKLALHYTILGFAPVVAVAALIIAVVAVNRAPAVPAQTVEATARIESLSASLLETRNELESIKLTLARERSARAEEHRKAEEREAMIVRHVTQLQARLKVSPVLEEQLKEAADIPAPAHGAPAAAAEHNAPAPSAPAATDKSHSAAPAAPAKKPAPAAPAPHAESEKSPAPVKALKEAIEKFNDKKK